MQEKARSGHMIFLYVWMCARTAPKGQKSWVFAFLFGYAGDREVIGSVLDITAEKATRLRLEAKQNQLTSLNESLEQQVAARTEVLTQTNQELEQLSSFPPPGSGP